MARDPATLWYWNDWQGGTMTMTRQAKGAYIDLLTAQFNSGHLSDTQIKTLLGGDQGLWGTVLREKFLVDGDGKYYNARLEEEILKRKSNNAKQSERAKKRWSGKATAYATALPKENENEIEDEIKNGNSFGKSENLLAAEPKNFPIEHCGEVALRDDRWAKANKATPAEVGQFNKFLEGQGVYEKNILDYKRYFANIKRKDPDKIKPAAPVVSIDDLRKQAKEYDERNKLKNNG